MLNANHSTHLTQINVDNHSFFTEIRQLQWAFFDLVERLQIYRSYVPTHILNRLDTIVDGAGLGDTELPPDLGNDPDFVHQRDSLSTGKRDSHNDDVSYEQIQSFRSPHTSWRTTGSDSYSFLSSPTASTTQVAGSALPGQAQQHQKRDSGRTTMRENSSGSFSKRIALFASRGEQNGGSTSSCHDHHSSHRSLRNSPECIDMGLRSSDTTVMSLRILNLSTLLKSPDAFVKQFETLTMTVNRLLRISKGQSASFDIDMMVFFWTANHVRNHEVRACDTIRRIISQVRELNLQWVAEKGFTPVEIGIGASSGPSLVGNVGAESDMKTHTIYSPTHDKAVSFAGLCAEWKSDCIIDKQVFMRVRYHFVTRPLTFHHCVISRRNVHHPLEDVHAFELGEKIETEDSEWMYTMQNQINASIWDQYNQAFDYFVSGDQYYKQALNSFRQHLDLSPNDVPTKKWIHRLEQELQKVGVSNESRVDGDQSQPVSPAPRPTQGAHQVQEKTLLLLPTSPATATATAPLSGQLCKNDTNNKKSMVEQPASSSFTASNDMKTTTTTTKPRLSQQPATSASRKLTPTPPTTAQPLKKRTRSYHRGLTASPSLPPLSLIRSHSVSSKMTPPSMADNSSSDDSSPLPPVHNRTNSLSSSRSRVSLKSTQILDLSDLDSEGGESNKNSARSVMSGTGSEVSVTASTTGASSGATSSRTKSKRNSLTFTPQRRSSLVADSYLIRIEDLQNM